MEGILKYFPELSGEQQEKFRELGSLFNSWNGKINLVSRKDQPHLYERHILHSLSIAKVVSFTNGSRILDVGTGGGFPGVPLAIMFPEAKFTLVDSIGKKIRVVNEIIAELNLSNATTITARAETLKGDWHFITSRAVSAFPQFYNLIGRKISREQFNVLPNGILYLKGGDFEDEISAFRPNIRIFSISDYFSEDFFETKKIIYLPLRRNDN